MTNQRCKVIVVGTHRDFVAGKEMFNLQLPELVPSDMKDRLIHYYTPSEVMFSINVLTPTAVDSRISEILVRRIGKELHSHAPMKVPMSWHMLAKHIHELVASKSAAALIFSECLELAHKVGLTDQSLKAALRYLTDINFLFYHEDVTSDIVITNPSTLPKIVSEILNALETKQFTQYFKKTEVGSIYEAAINRKCLSDARFISII